MAGVPRILTALAVSALLMAAPAGALAESAPDAGTAFEPAPSSQPLYGVKAPSDDPDRQEHVVEAGDGVDLFVETWLPVQKAGGPVPPGKVPTVLVMSPYINAATPEEYPDEIQYFVERGFAVAQHHVRGTGNSGGCLEQTASNQIDDGARVVEYLGRDADWSNGNVGMFGVSYDAETQISVAGRGDPQRTKWLKAVVPAASVGGQYEYSFFDGVPYAGQALLSNTSYLAFLAAPGWEPSPDWLRKPECQGEVFVASADQSGDLTPFWQDREYRPGAPNVRAATLMVHGLNDWNVKPITEAGWYERLPESTPHKGLFGVWEHAFPDSHDVQPDWERADWLPMVTAWYDRYLKGIQTGVESWPDVQAQGTDGQWRAFPDWPTTGGPAGQLALGPDGALGASAPEGSSSYVEALDEDDDVTGSKLVFETGALASPLQLVGQPALDLWVQLDEPDAHVGAQIDVLDAAGDPIEEGTDFGYRSARHLDPLVDNRFVQETGKDAPVDQPLRVLVRFHPAYLRVPAGGKLRVTIAGSIDGSEPSGSQTGVTVLHDCEHTSALRFLMPGSESSSLNVREKDETSGVLASNPPVTDGVDGGGVASAPVCGRAPERLPMFGPVFEPKADGSVPAPGAPASGIGGRRRAGCATDTGKPASSVLRRKLRASKNGLLLRGRTGDRGCSQLSRTQVAVAKRAGKRCAFLTRKRRFTRTRSCSKPVWLRASGRSSWALRSRVRLTPGRYVVLTRARDRAGNLERAHRALSFRLR